MTKKEVIKNTLLFLSAITIWILADILVSLLP